MARDSFILYTEQKEIFESLSDEQAGKLIKQIFNYINTGQEPTLDGMLKVAFIPIRQNLDRNNDKWEDVKKKRSEAGKAGAKKRWDNKDEKKEIAKIANAKFDRNEIAKIAVNVNDNVNVNVNDNVTTTVVNSKGDSCVDGLSKIIEFYNNNIGLITPYGAEVLEDYSKEMPSELIIYAMQISVEANKRNIKYIKAILNNWSNAGIKTLVEAKQENKSKKSISAEEEFMNE